MGKELKIGLALGGGGARGLAHIGVLKVLQRENIPISCIVGSSMGAIVGGLFAHLQSVEAVEERIVRFLQSKEFLHMGIEVFARPAAEFRHQHLDHLFTNLKMRFAFARAFRHPAIFDKERVDRIFAEQLEDVPIPSLKIHFGAIATDLVTGEEILLQWGSLRRALQASSAIPGIFPPVPWNGRLLIDGAASDSVPAGVVRQLGASIVVAVNVTKCIRQKPELKNALQILFRADEISSWHLTQERLREADLIIKPAVNRVSWANFKRHQELIRRGEISAEESLPHLRAMIERHQALQHQSGESQ